MSKVGAKIKVMPESPDVDLDELQEIIELGKLPDDDEDEEDDSSLQLPDGTTVRNVDREDIGFGLRALIVNFVIPDDSGGADKVVTFLERIDSVESARVEQVGRL